MKREFLQRKGRRGVILQMCGDSSEEIRDESMRDHVGKLFGEATAN